MNKIFIILGLWGMIVTTVDLDSYDWKASGTLILLFWTWMFISSLLEEIKK